MKVIRLGIYQHYNGNYYQVIGLARHSETTEEMVVYQAMYGDYGIWVRPAHMFEEIVTIENKLRPRFIYISEGIQKAPSIR